MDIKDLTLLDKKGSGGYSFIYTTYYNNNVVAAKIYFKNKLVENQEIIKKEIDVLKKIQNNNFIINFYEPIFDNNNYIGYLMEFLPNGNLREVLNKQKNTFDYKFKKKIYLDLIFGLEFIHNKDIIHNDIKSFNIMLYKDTIKYIDFGSSHFGKINNETNIKSIRWCSPETLIFNKSTYKSDIYSLCLVLWEIETLKIPFINIDDDQKIKNFIKEDKTSCIHHINTSYILSYIIKKGLNIDPDVRPGLKKMKNLIDYIY